MTAIISPDGKYRYRLERPGVGPGATAVIMVNPSTADGEQDDHTIRKLVGFGERLQWGKLIVGNIFAYRATNVKDLADADDPVGSDNGYRLAEIFLDAQRAVFAWGASAKFPRNYARQWEKVHQLCLAMHLEPLSIGPVAKDGHPRHPLMLSYDLTLQPWSAP